MKKIFILYVLFIFIISNILFAQDTGISKLPSLLWQKDNLAKNIKHTITTSLKTVLKQDQYFIDVKIDTKNIIKPDFSKTDKSGDNVDSANDGKSIKTAELLSKFEKIEELKTKENKQAKVNAGKIKFEDKNPSEKDGDYIVFSKFGIVAPLIDDFNDFHPDGKIILSMKTGTAEVKKRIEKLKGKLKNKNYQIKKIKKDLDRKNFLLKNGSKKASIIEQMWKYNESIDIFKNIKKVKININVSNEISKDKRVIIKSIVNSLSFNLGKMKPQINIKYLNFQKNIKKKDLSYYLNILSKFSGIIATIIGVILLGFVLSNIIKKLENIFGSAGASNSNLNGIFKNEDDDKEKENSPLGAGTGGNVDGDSSIGIERFESFLDKSSTGAVNLVKKWIKSNGPQEIAALRAIVQQLDNAKLMQIFQIIGIEEREVWKEYLDKTLSDTELTKTNSFISKSIVEEIIAPSAITDEEINDMMLQISSKKAAEFVMANPSLGAILLNIMNKNFVGEVLNFISSKKIASVIEEGMKFRRDTINNQLDKLKEKLVEFVDHSERVPFVKRVEELIPYVSPDKETAMYINLIKYSNLEIFMSTAKKYYPNELLIALPTSFLKEKLRDYELSSKIEYLLTLDEEKRNYLVNIFAPAGTKAADLLDFEFKKSQEDEAIQAKINSEAVDIQRDYLNYIRGEIKGDDKLAIHINAILEKWGEGIIAGNDPYEIVNTLYDTQPVTDYQLDEAS